jgi:hypothetical protein
MSASVLKNKVLLVFELLSIKNICFVQKIAKINLMAGSEIYEPYEG